MPIFHLQALKSPLFTYGDYKNNKLSENASKHSDIYVVDMVIDVHNALSHGNIKHEGCDMATPYRTYKIIRC